MAPETVRTQSAPLDQRRRGHEQQPDRDGDVGTLVVRGPLPEEEGREVHREVPEHEAERRDEKRKASEVEGTDGGERGNYLHRHPAGLDRRVEEADLAGILARPEIRPFLEGVDPEGHDRDGGEDEERTGCVAAGAKQGHGQEREGGKGERRQTEHCPVAVVAPQLADRPGGRSGSQEGAEVEKEAVRVEHRPLTQLLRVGEPGDTHRPGTLQAPADARAARGSRERPDRNTPPGGGGKRAARCRRRPAVPAARSSRWRRRRRPCSPTGPMYRGDWRSGRA